jgi:transposase
MDKSSSIILATNVLDNQELESEEILKRYKEQQSTERGFRFIKDPLFFADSLFVKNPERVETMMMLMALCLLVYNLAHIPHPQLSQIKKAMKVVHSN